MKSRDYQKKAESCIISEWKAGNRKTLLVLPTGTGKTVVLSSIIRSQFPKKAMVIAHREELIYQAKEKIERITGLRVEVEMGESKAFMDADFFHPEADVIVATVQTLCVGGDGSGRLGKFNPNDFGILIVDEAHHIVTSSYKRIIDHFCQNSQMLVLGVTATPDRADEEALGQIFDSVAFDYEILDAINDGWLVPIEQQMISVGDIDLTKVRTTAGDLNGQDLAKMMESEKNLHGVANPTIDILGSRRGIGFAASVAHAQILTDIFNRHRYGMAACVSAKTDKEDRKKIISQFADGSIQFLWNCGVFTEGFDDSGVEVVSMGRMTKSRSLYAQMAGRATRPHESIAHRLNDIQDAILRRGMIRRSCKPSCLILDFVGNSGKHKLITSADILGGNVSEQAAQEAKEFMLRTGKPQKVAELLDEKEKEIEARKKAEFIRKAKIVAKVEYKSQRVDPFDVLQVKPAQVRGWDKGRVLTEPQKKIMREYMGLNPDDFEYPKAKQLIDQQFRIWELGLCSFKMMKKLRKFGIDASSMKKEIGHQYLDAIAKNGWHGLPPGFEPGTFNFPIPPRPTKATSNDDIPF